MRGLILKEEVQIINEQHYFPTLRKNCCPFNIKDQHTRIVRYIKKKGQPIEQLK